VSLASIESTGARMRRACSQFEAWGAWPRSRFAARSANCLKFAQRRRELERKKTAPFGKALVLTAATNFEIYLADLVEASSRN
jgi:hypothetical protein